MQLLICYDTTDKAAFRKAYDEHPGPRDEAGLTQLQLWEEAEAPSRIWALYGVIDEERARAWLTREGALARHVDHVTAHFLATA